MSALRLSWSAALLLSIAMVAPAAAAAVRVEIEGLRGATLRDNAQRATSLHGWRDRTISEAQVRRLHEQAPGEIRKVLETQGYYRALIEPELRRAGEDWVATYTIRVRTSIKVRELDVRFEGPGADDPTLRALVAAFPLQSGDRLVHNTYERGKTALRSAIQGHGYLRARPLVEIVEVHVGDIAADVRLHWQTGPRYRMGEVQFEGAQFPDGFMQRFVQHEKGGWYDADELLDLQRRLIDADYFGFVSVAPQLRGRGGHGVGGPRADPAALLGDYDRDDDDDDGHVDDADGKAVGEAASAHDGAGDQASPADERRSGKRRGHAVLAAEDAVTGASATSDAPGAAGGDPARQGAGNGNNVVPILVRVAPAPRTVYSGGVSVGTDSGFGVRAGIRQRWLNQRGHKANAEFEFSQRRSAVATNYEVPLPGNDLRSFNFGATHLREETETSESENSSLFAMENRLWRGWLRDLGLRALYSDFTIAEQRNRSTLVFAEGRLSRRRANDDLFPTRGYSLRFEARAGSEALLSDTDFVQVRAEARYIHPFGARQRGYLRGIVGATHVDDFNALPPQLRFFAGGDQTIRGYGYQALGPTNDEGFVIGGKHLAVLSAEFERDIARSWAIAGFVDTGNAFSDSSDFELRTGVGVGVRWRSPVGLVRLDLGHGLDSPRNVIELHVVIGPNL